MDYTEPYHIILW